MVARAMLALALLAGSAAAAAQKPPPCKGRLVADPGWTSLGFTKGRNILALDYVEFGSEPTLGGIHGAAAGRLQEGDVLVAVDDLLLLTRAGAERFRLMKPGVPVRLTVRRSGRNLDVTLTPGSRCIPPRPRVGTTGVREAPSAAPAGAPPMRPRGSLGLVVSCTHCASRVTPQGAVEWLRIGALDVAAVDRGSPAERAGLRPGDQVEVIDGMPLASSEGAARMGAIAPGQRVRLGIRRDGHTLVVELVAAAAPCPPGSRDCTGL